MVRVIRIESCAYCPHSHNWVNEMSCHLAKKVIAPTPLTYKQTKEMVAPFCPLPNVHIEGD